MRVLSNKVRRMVIIFGILIVGCLALVIASAGLVIRGRADSYPVAADSVIYDNAHNSIVLTEDGQITRSKDGTYYLSSGGQRYSLGSRNVVYDYENDSVVVLGGGYQIHEDSSVAVLDDFSTLPCSDTGFVKMGDSDFLMTGRAT